jgi:hypothetical protein
MVHFGDVVKLYGGMQNLYAMEDAVQKARGAQARFAEILKAKLIRNLYLSSTSSVDKKTGELVVPHRRIKGYIFDPKTTHLHPRDWKLADETKQMNNFRGVVVAGMLYTRRLDNPKLLSNFLYMKEEWIPGFHKNPPSIDAIPIIKAKKA